MAKITSATKTYTLELSESEAQYIFNVLALATADARDTIFDALADVGFEYTDTTEGTITHKGAI